MQNQKIFFKILCVFCSLSLMLSVLLLPVSAAENDDVKQTYRWSYIQSISVDINFNGTNGSVNCTASRQTSATSIEGTVYLYRYQSNTWVLMDSWHNSTTRKSLPISGTFNAVGGTQYKAVFYVTAHNGNASENASIETVKTCN